MRAEAKIIAAVMTAVCVFTVMPGTLTQTVAIAEEVSASDELNNIKSKSDGIVIRVWNGRYDQDRPDAEYTFAVVHKELQDDDMGEDSLWFASPETTKCIFKDEIFAYSSVDPEYTNQAVITLPDNRVMLNSGFDSGVVTNALLWYVQDGEAKKVTFKGGMLEGLYHVSGYNFMSFQENFEYGRDYLAYPLYLDGTTLKEYGSKYISQKQFKKYRNGSKYLSRIKKKKYKIKKIILRDNGMINVNVYKKPKNKYLVGVYGNSCYTFYLKDNKLTKGRHSGAYTLKLWE